MKRRDRLLKARHHTATLVEQMPLSLIESLLNVFGVRHRVSFRLQLLLFAADEACRTEFIELELKEVLIAGVRLNLLDQLVELLQQVTIVRVGLHIGFQLIVVVCYDVDHLKLKIVLIEKQVLMLRMHIDQPFTELLEQGESHGRIVDESAALTR